MAALRNSLKAGGGPTKKQAPTERRDRRAKKPARRRVA